MNSSLSKIMHNPSEVSWQGYLRWQLRDKLILLGIPGIIALALLLAGVVFYFVSIRPLQTGIVLAQRTVDPQRVAVKPVVKSTPTLQLAEFYKYFPAENKAPVWLGKLVEVAGEHGLSLNDAEYKVSQDKVGQLIRMKIAFPVQGKYPQIREFLAALVNEIPSMALENVEFVRNTIADTSVEAKIKVVLYLVQKS